MRDRSGILYVILDRPQDATEQRHASNIGALRAVLTAFDANLVLRVVPLAEIAASTTRLEGERAPLAIFAPGSFSEWFHYGSDATWRWQLDRWMHTLRRTTIPTLAVCGSHQLVAMAFNGMNAVAHMNDAGSPVPILDELLEPEPRPLWPEPRVGEEGSYPIVATPAAEADPWARALPSRTLAALHHKDMVIDTRGFTVLYEGDATRPAATRAGDQAVRRCRVQAMRLDERDRLLYSMQFHPEFGGFGESTEDDGGFGTRCIHRFLDLAREFHR